ncbi:MAG: hypothetical protein HYX63_20105 [Gammaproteobacteria bacterium]|nr:hypothetical protein [Gammaproteobacteria bacterium]
MMTDLGVPGGFNPLYGCDCTAGLYSPMPWQLMMPVK